MYYSGERSKYIGEVKVILQLKVLDKQGKVLFSQKEATEIDGIYPAEFQEGDCIRIDVTESEYLAICLDETLKESIVYVPAGKLVYPIHKEYNGFCFDNDAFLGGEHKLKVRIPTDEEIYGYRNIVLNAHDLPEAKGSYPHVSANYVTRQDPNFFERNAINGTIHPEGHWGYPYSNWAGGDRDDLEFTIDFGTEVMVEKLVFYLRADFPHDSYWNGIDLVLGDGETVTGAFRPTGEGQEVILPEAKKTRTIQLTRFTQPVDPLSWAGLAQIEVYGNYIKEDFSKMEIRCASNPKDVKHYTTDRLREEFHISKLFTKDNIKMVYSHIDRIITAGLMPVYQELRLEGGKELASDYFLERREMGCINIGGKGIVTVDGVEYEMNPRDGIYIGMGNKEISFKSVNAEEPAKFYVSSCPAHATYPIVKIDITKAKKVPCGSVEDCNKRVINQYIHPEVIKSCQLAMGLTELEPGSNWNTMPSHTHDRRMEVYLYLDMGEDDAVFHMMGEPNETRHIIMHNEEAVISPSWSIHSGVGTKAYSFIWAMCGENQEFTDMDHIETRDLR